LRPSIPNVISSRFCCLLFLTAGDEFPFEVELNDRVLLAGESCWKSCCCQLRAAPSADTDIAGIAEAFLPFLPPAGSRSDPDFCRVVFWTALEDAE
jgi:hypothetical protein